MLNVKIQIANFLLFHVLHFETKNWVQTFWNLIYEFTKHVSTLDKIGAVYKLMNLKDIQCCYSYLSILKVSI